LLFLVFSLFDIRRDFVRAGYNTDVMGIHVELVLLGFVKQVPSQQPVVQGQLENALISFLIRVNILNNLNLMIFLNWAGFLVAELVVLILVDV